MNPLSIVLKKLRESKKLTIEELARKAGIGKGTVGDIETGKSKSTVKTLDKIATALNLSQNERDQLYNAFLGRKAASSNKVKEEKNNIELSYDADNLVEKYLNPIEMMTIPVYSSVAAGCGYIPDAEPIDYITIQKISGDCIGVKVNGDSMEPTLFNDDIVILKKDIEVGIGEIGVFINKATGESLVKRLKKKNGVFILESDNHIFKDREIKSDEICCCGKVVSIMKKNLQKRVNPLQELLDDIPVNKMKLAEKLLKTLIADDEE